MSVVAGCSLLNGVLLAADCRSTIKRHHASDVHVDTVQKIFGVLPHTAIGFVGDIGAAGFKLYHLLVQVRRKKKRPRGIFSAGSPDLSGILTRTTGRKGADIEGVGYERTTVRKKDSKRGRWD